MKRGARVARLRHNPVSTPIVSLGRPCARGRAIGASATAAPPIRLRPIRLRRVEIILLLSLLPPVRPRPYPRLMARFQGCAQEGAGQYPLTGASVPAAAAKTGQNCDGGGRCINATSSMHTNAPPAAARKPSMKDSTEAC